MIYIFTKRVESEKNRIRHGGYVSANSQTEAEILSREKVEADKIYSGASTFEAARLMTDQEIIVCLNSYPS